MSIHDTLNTSLNRDLSPLNTTEPTHADSKIDALKRVAPQLQTLQASLVKSVALGYDWTRDAYISSSLADIMESEPTVGKLLERKSGLELLSPKNHQSFSLASLHLSEAGRLALLWAVESIYCEVMATGTEAAWGENATDAVAAQRYIWFTAKLDNPGTASSENASDAGEAERYRAFKAMLEQKRTENSAEMQPDISPEYAEKLPQFISTTGAEIMQKVLRSWESQQDMLQEFRTLGTNREHVTVDFQQIDSMATQMSVLEKSPNLAVGDVAKALRGILHVLSPDQAGRTVLLETGADKMNVRLAVRDATGLAGALQSAESALKENMKWSASGTAQQAAELYSVLNAAEVALKQAAATMNGTIVTLINDSELGWMLGFRSVAEKHQKSLRASCKKLSQELEQAKRDLTENKHLQAALLEKTEKALAAVGSVPLPQMEPGVLAETQDAICGAADALKSLCFNMKMARLKVKEDSHNPRLAAETLNSLSFTMEMANHMVKGDPHYPRFAKDALKTLSGIVKNANVHAEKDSHPPSIAADALTTLAFNTQKANLKPEEARLYPRINEVAASVYEMTAVLTDMEAALPGTDAFINFGGNPEQAEFMADKLQMLAERATKAAKSLNKKSDALKTLRADDPETSRAFQDIADRIDSYKATLDTAINKFLDVKHCLRPKNSFPELMVKKLDKVAGHVKNQKDTAISVVPNWVKSTALASGSAIASYGQEKRNYPERKAEIDNRIKLQVRRMQDSIEFFSRKVGELTSAVKSKVEFNTYNAGKALKKKQNLLGETKGTQQAEKKSQQLDGLKKKYPDVQKALKNCHDEINEALGGLRAITAENEQLEGIIAPVRKQIDRTVGWIEKSSALLEQAMEQLTLPVKMPEGNGGAALLIRREMELMREAIAGGLDIAEADGNKAEDILKSFARATACLEQAVPDREGFLSACGQLETHLNNAQSSAGRHGGGVRRVQPEMKRMQEAIAAGLETAEALGDRAEDVLHKARKAFAAAAFCLEKAEPDTEGFLSALGRVETHLNSALVSTGEEGVSTPVTVAQEKLALVKKKVVSVPIAVAQEKLTQVKEMVTGWRTEEAAQALPGIDRFDDFVRATQKITSEADRELSAYKYAFTDATGNYVDPFSKDARIIKHLAEFLTQQRKEIEEDDRELYDQITDMVIDNMKDEFQKPGDEEGHYFAAALKAEYGREGRGVSVKAKTVAELNQKYRSFAEHMLKGGGKGLLGQALYSGLTWQIDALLNTAFPCVSALRIGTKLTWTIKTMMTISKEVDKSQMPGLPSFPGDKSKLLQQEALKKGSSIAIAALPSVIKTVARVGLTAGHIYIAGFEDTLKEVVESLPSDVVWTLPGVGLGYGIKANHNALNLAAEEIKTKIRECPLEDREALLRTYDQSRPEVQKAFVDLYNELKAKEQAAQEEVKLGAALPPNQDEDMMISDMAGSKEDESEVHHRVKRGAVQGPAQTPEADEIGSLMSKLSKKHGIEFSADTIVEVYQANPEYGIKKMRLKAALENKNGNNIIIRHPFHNVPLINGPLIDDLNDYLLRNADPDKMRLLAKQMTPEQWVNYLEFKYGETLSNVSKVVRYSDGEEVTKNLLEELRKENGDLDCFYMPTSIKVIKDLKFYAGRFNDKNLPESELTRRDERYFKRTLAYYNLKGDITQLDQLIKSGELPESSRTFLADIKSTKSKMDEKIKSKRRYQAILNVYDIETNRKIKKLQNTTDRKMRQEITNQIVFLKQERQIYAAMQKHTSEAIRYLKVHPMTFSDEPRKLACESLIVAYKIKFPRECVGLSDKQIYNKATLLLANKNNYKFKKQSLADMHQFVYYIGFHKKEWSGNNSDTNNANRFYNYIYENKNKSMTLLDISTTFSNSTESPAKNYKSLIELNPISEYWSMSDANFYQQFEDYKNNDARNEATDDVHYLTLSSGIYPQDLNEPPVAVKKFKIEVPVEEIRYSEPVKTAQLDFNHYNTEKGSVILFQTKSGDYWAYNTVSNNKTLTRIDKETFDKYSTDNEFDDVDSVNEFFKKTGVEKQLLPAPKTTSPINKYLDTTDKITFFFIHLKRKIEGLPPKNIIPQFDIEQRYYKVSSSGDLNASSNKSINTMMIDDATETNKQSADDKKEFSTFDRRAKPRDWDSLTFIQKLARATHITYGHGKDILLGLFKPAEVYIRHLQDEGYDPSEEDMAEVYFDFAVVVATLGYGAVSKGVSVTKAALGFAKEARELGLTGKAFKRFMYKSMAPYMKESALSAATAPVTELLPGYSYGEMVVSMGKSAPTLTDLGVVTSLTNKVADDNKENEPSKVLSDTIKIYDGLGLLPSGDFKI